MNLGTLLRFLFGNREAILTIAGARRAIWVGLLFVMAAGLAREYDGEDLLHEPWHLLIPLGASLGSCAVLFLLVQIVVASGAKRSLLVQFREFLTLYWMTAPLALLYGIPFERFLLPGPATEMNLYLLGLVALWRVVLITRVLTVLYGMRWWGAFPLVMLFADTVLLVVLYFTPLPILSIMGGIRLSESERVLQGITLIVGTLGRMTWPVWLLWAIAGSVTPVNHAETTSGEERTAVARHLWGLGFAAIAMWLPFLPHTQREQQLRRQVERDLKGGRIAEALMLMSAHEPDDFPPHWDPPPRVAYGESTPNIQDINKHLNDVSVAPWVRDVFVGKLANSLHGRHTSAWVELAPEELEERLQLLEHHPDRVKLVREISEELQVLDFNSDRLPRETLIRIHKLLKEAGIEHQKLPDAPPGSQPEPFGSGGAAPEAGGVEESSPATPDMAERRGE